MHLLTISILNLIYFIKIFEIKVGLLSYHIAYYWYPLNFNLDIILSEQHILRCFQRKIWNTGISETQD